MNTNTRNSNLSLKNNKTPTLFEKLKIQETFTTASTPPTTVILCFVLVLVLLIFILRLLFNEGHLFTYRGISKTTSSMISDVILGLSILFSLFFILLLFFPSGKEMGSLLSNLSGSFVVIGYTFFLLYCFYTIPTDKFTTYASTLVPFFLFLTAFVFGGALVSSFINSANVKKPLYDRIQTMILFFCFVVTTLLFYVINPGNYITDHFGSFSLFTLLLGVFIFVYLILLFVVPDQIQLSSLTSFTWSWGKIIGIAVSLLFIVLIAIGIDRYPGGFFSQENVWPSLTITLLVSLVFSILSIFAITQFTHDKSTGNQKMGIAKLSLLSVFGLLISGLFITWLVFGIESATGTSGIISFLLNAGLILVILAFIYRSLNPHFTKDSRENIGSLFTKLVFFLPCFFSNTLDTFTRLISNPESYDQISSVILIILVIVLFFFWIQLKSTVNNSSFFQGNLLKGTVLVNSSPIPLNTIAILGSYEDLNHLTNTTLPIQHNYQYSISLSFFLESNPSNSAYQEYKSILNYGNKPEVLYRHADNSLLITMEKNGLREIPHNVGDSDLNKGTIDFSNNKIIIENPDEYDSKGIYKNSRILYKREKIQLQRWNHLVLNYVNGTLDIFYNGKLVKTVVELVPYLTLDSLTVGAENGVQGQIKNVNYYPVALTLNEIRTLI